MTNCKSSSFLIIIFRRVAPRHFKSMTNFSSPFSKTKSALPLMSILLNLPCKSISDSCTFQPFFWIIETKLHEAYFILFKKLIRSGPRPYINKTAPSRASKEFAWASIHCSTCRLFHPWISSLNSNSKNRWDKFPIIVVSRTILKIEDLCSLILCRKTHW